MNAAENSIFWAFLVYMLTLRRLARRVMQFRLRTPLTTRSLVPHPSQQILKSSRSIVPCLQPAHQSDGNGSTRSEHLLKQPSSAQPRCPTELIERGKEEHQKIQPKVGKRAGREEYSEDEVGDGSDIEPSPLITTDAAYEDDDDFEDNGVSHAWPLSR